ncbi:hypothetical protein RRG08_021124 [Elysia crispata]|uniref:Uncharacterized protein n=1 Tax=Elysia crispata TaxID=231223 RepID=A0AAE0Z754_9GAST|nr:hypothetical protein RRG08_021124 [Elysia crispata]
MVVEYARAGATVIDKDVDQGSVYGGTRSRRVNLQPNTARVRVCGAEAKYSLTLSVLLTLSCTRRRTMRNHTRARTCLNARLA